jgi:hypothetical protein
MGQGAADREQAAENGSHVADSKWHLAYGKEQEQSAKNYRLLPIADR